MGWECGLTSTMSKIATPRVDWRNSPVTHFDIIDVSLSSGFPKIATPRVDCDNVADSHHLRNSQVSPSATLPGLTSAEPK